MILFTAPQEMLGIQCFNEWQMEQTKLDFNIISSALFDVVRHLLTLCSPSTESPECQINFKDT